MIYPDNFEDKIGFNEIRLLLKERCLSMLGKEEVDEMSFTTDCNYINSRLEELREFRRIGEEADDFPLDNFFDLRQSITRIRLEGTHLEIDELFDLKRSMETIINIIAFLSRGEEIIHDEVKPAYPALYALADGIATFPELVQRIAQIIDKLGNMRDNASPELLQIRNELSRTEHVISRTLHAILRSAQSDGVVEHDVAPTLRDGRLVIPVAQGLKRKISGIVHDESASGRTVYVEPTEVVEANNRIRELENEERREIIRILRELTKKIRPHTAELLDSYRFLAKIDFIRAKAELAKLFKAFEPEVHREPFIDWIRAVHPLLQRSLERKGTGIIPLDIQLVPEKRILIISGPNAGGKSVCLKTVGLLQYMLQCGLAIPVADRSRVGIFDNIMIDIGDEQSIENDLSTYSSHLTNMKQMIRQANDSTLILIDEFGTGTEPQIGGAIAESVLKQFWQRQAWAVITTHYQNLKHFAEGHPGVVNGAMLYDRHEMRPLFQLAIGRPGSSFAIEIARKTGLPRTVIDEASEIVGTDYIQSDKYLQDIVRDKRYWEAKRQTIHSREKELERKIQQYEERISQLENSRKEILNRTKEQAQEMFRESNKRIENAIREIREKQAEKEETKRIRQQLTDYESAVITVNEPQSATQTSLDSGLMNPDDFEKELQRIKNRRDRHEQHKQRKAEQHKAAATSRHLTKLTIVPGATVKMKGLDSIGRVEHIDGNQATVIFGSVRTRVQLARLENADTSTVEKQKKQFQAFNYSRETRETIDQHRKHFKSELDVRGERTEEALTQVQYFIDDAILVGVSQVRILHGKGNGILRQMIRQYLSTLSNVRSFHDEHVQFGGSGITIVEL